MPNTEAKVWYTLEDAQKVIAESDKKILLDIYKDDCDESKHLQEKVLPEKAVEDTLSKYFCSVKINANSEDSLKFNGKMRTNREIAEMLEVTDYPTIVFLDKNGDKIIITSGNMEADMFTKVLSYVGSDAYLKTEFDLFVEEQ
ncbi:MAG: thioredoxin fold domain-containing protein [Balneolales bacterium]